MSGRPSHKEIIELYCYETGFTPFDKLVYLVLASLAISYIPLAVVLKEVTWFNTAFAAVFITAFAAFLPAAMKRTRAVHDHPVLSRYLSFFPVLVSPALFIKCEHNAFMPGPDDFSAYRVLRLWFYLIEAILVLVMAAIAAVIVYSIVMALS